MKTWNEVLKDQLGAALETLRQCTENCPEALFNAPHQDAPFSQVLFHTLFYADYYLSEDPEHFKAQAFHSENRGLFKDYEELIDKVPENLYTREEIELYSDFCLGKAGDVLLKCEDRKLMRLSRHRRFSYAELYIYTIRHTQHHAAQLGLRLQLSTGRGLKWIGSGGSS